MFQPTPDIDLTPKSLKKKNEEHREQILRYAPTLSNT
jgi:hypothetical protein